MISESKAQALIANIQAGHVTFPQSKYDSMIGMTMASAATWYCQEITDCMFFCGSGQVFGQLLEVKMLTDTEIKKKVLRLKEAPITVLDEFRKAEPFLFGAAIELAIAVGLTEKPGRMVMAGAALIWSVCNGHGS